MKNIFTNKNVGQKIIISILAVIVLGFVFSKVTYGFDGGKLFQPIMDLIVAVGDLVISLVQDVVLGIQESLISVDRGADIVSSILGVLAGILVAAAIVAATIASGGGALAIVLACLGATAAGVGTGVVTKAVTEEMLPDNIQYAVFALSPQEIFSNQIYLLDVNFINPREVDEDHDYYKTDENGDIQPSIAATLRDTIARWYVALRNIAIVGLLSVLIYIGIRMMMTSLASEKAKYRQLIFDWLVALCLVFILHYVMAFSTTIVEKISEMISATLGKDPVQTYYIQDDKSYDYFEKLSDESDDIDYKGNGTIYEENGKKMVKWNAANFMAQARMNYQFLNDNGEPFAVALSYGIIYIVLIVYTIYFLFVYIKRVVYMAFLTLIAPLVALTYPIDKVTDGKAQAFDMWLKEFLFNLLIQPMHLVLYVTLIGSAMALASVNPLYVLVALGFMVPAEKLLRRFFGFEKAQTPGGLLGGALGASAVMNGINSLRNLGSKGRAGNKGGSDEVEGKTRTDKKFNEDFDETAVLAAGGADYEEDDSPSTGYREQDDPGYWSQLAADADGYDDNANQRQAELDEYDSYRNQFPPEDYDSEGLNDSGYWDQLAGAAGGYLGDREQRQAELDEYERAERQAELEEQARQRQQALQEERENQAQATVPIRQANIPDGNQHVDASAQTKPTNLKGDKKALNKARRKAAMRVIKPKMKRAAITGIRTAGAVGLGAVGAAAAGATTLALTGDPSKSIGATIGGAAAAGSLGYNAPKQIENISKDKIMEHPYAQGFREIRDAYYGNDEEYKEKQQNKQVKKMMKDTELETYLSQKFGEQEMQQMKDSGELEQYIRHDIVDKKEIAAAHKLLSKDEKEGGVDTVDQAIAVAKYSQRIGENTNGMSGKKKAEWSRTFDNEFASAKGVKNQKHAQDLTQGTFRKLDAFNKEKYK